MIRTIIKYDKNKIYSVKLMRYFTFIILFSMQLFAEDFFGKVIKDINISKDFKTYKEANLSDYSSNEYLSTVSLKFRFNKEPLEKEVYYLVVISDVDSLSFYECRLC